MLSFSSLSRSSQTRLAGARQLGLGRLGERDDSARGGGCACRSSCAALGEPLERVLADRLEHPEPRLAVGRLALADEAVVDERGDPVEHLAELEPERLSGDGLGRLERAAADEDAEAREERLAARRRAGCSSTRSRRGASRAAAPPPVRNESRFSSRRVEDLLRRQQLHARRGELDRERDALEPAADLRDGLEVVVGRARSSASTSCARSTKSCTAGESAPPSPATRHRERRHRVLALAADAERRAARGEHLEARRAPRAARAISGAAAEHAARSCRARAALGRSPSRSRDRGRERLLGRLADAERVGDRGADELRVAGPARGRRSSVVGELGAAARWPPRARGASCRCRRGR